MNMSESQILEQLRKSVVDGSTDKAVEAAQLSIQQCVDPLTAYEEGLRKGITEVGDAFECGDLFLPDLVIAAKAMQAATAILEEEISRTGRERQRIGKIVLGTVAGDLHDIGKKIVATLMSSHGFEVIDLGVNVDVDKFIDAIKREKPDIIGISSLLTITALEIPRIIQKLEETGLRDQVKVMAGGGAVTQEYVQKIGADGYGRDAEMAVRVARELLNII
jgi:corrinoid protein of di/trimethylamine methyltransferase